MRPRSADDGWKRDERAAFLDRLRAAEARTLLQVGAGAEPDSAWFEAEGLAVTPVAGDVRHLGLPESSFDAAFSVGALPPVPNVDLDDALGAVQTVLAPGGLFFFGAFGDKDQQILSYAQKQFDILDFHVVKLADGWRFQALTLVRP